MKRLSAAPALFAAAIALAQQPTPEDIMARNDINEDGVITRAEAREAGTPLAMIFDRVDSDGDGRITMRELENMDEAD